MADFSTTFTPDPHVRQDAPELPVSDLPRALATTQALSPEGARASTTERRSAARPALRPLPPALTRRSLSIALLLVALMAAFTPYNDYVLQNTPLIGNHFPIGILSVMALLVLAVNPAIRFLGRTPLRSGELIVIMAMLLVAAAIPSSGLMRYWEPMLLGQVYHVARLPMYRELVDLLPHWLLPTRDASAGPINDYYLGIDPREPGPAGLSASMLQHLHAYLGLDLRWLARVPLVPFLLPWLTGGLLMAAILGATMFLAAILRKQWVHHERLAYPLSTIPLELLADPDKGEYYNKLWRNPVLWAGVAIPAAVYLLNGLHDLWPGVPSVKLGYDFSLAFSDYPWDQIPHFIYKNGLFFSVVGICFFIPSEVALSLWLFLIVNGVLRVFFTPLGIDIGQTESARGIGIYLGYFAGILWLARRHLFHVARSAWLGSPREDSEFASYRAMLLGLLVCGGVAWLWLTILGIQPLVAALVLALGFVLVTLMSRVLAETGLFFLGTMWVPDRVISALLGPNVVSTGSYYLSALTSRVFFGDLRETLMPYATTSLRLGNSSDVPASQRWRLFKWLGVALLVSALVSGLSNHFLSYKRGRAGLHDSYASNNVPEMVMSDAYAYSNGAEPLSKPEAWTHVGLGAGMVGVLMLGRATIVAWPFHPIGLLLMNAWPLQVFWFSIMIGWGIKQLLLRYGGVRAFRRARPFFIGLIVGEMLAGGLWLIVGVATSGAVRYNLFPG